MFVLFAIIVLFPSVAFANVCLTSSDVTGQEETSKELNPDSAKKDISKDTLKRNQSNIVEEVDSSKNIKLLSNMQEENNNIHDIVVNYYDNDNKDKTINSSFTTHVVGSDLNMFIPIGNISAELVSCMCDNNNVSVSVINDTSTLSIKGNLESYDSININLYYDLSKVLYTVHYMFENNDNSAFTEKKTSAYQGKNGAEVPFSNQIIESFDGYALSQYNTLTLTYLSNNNVYIYYKWIRYSVEFDCNGGIGGPATIHQKSGEAITAPSQIPYKDGMNFECWCTDSDCKKAAVFPYVFNSKKNIKLYARWAQKQKDPIVTVVKWVQNPNANDQKLRYSEQKVDCVFGESFQYTGDAPKNTTLVENPEIVPDANSNNIVDVIYQYEERTIWFFESKEKANVASKLSDDEEKSNYAIGCISGQIGQDIYDKLVAINSDAFSDGQGWWTDILSECKFTSLYTIEDCDLYCYKDMPESDTLTHTLNVWTLKLDADKDWLENEKLPLYGDVNPINFEKKETLKVQSVPDEYPELFGFKTPIPGSFCAPSLDASDEILNCYYIRKSNTIVFYDGVSSYDYITDVAGVRYGQSINSLSVNWIDDNGVEHETKISDYVPKHPDNKMVPASLVFGGWYMSTVKSGEKVDLSDADLLMPDQDLELYANYVRVSYDVRFHDPDKKIISTVSVCDGDKIPLTDVPNLNKEGYEFVGWQYIGADGNYVDFDLSTDTVQGNLDLYPNFWKIIISDDKGKTGDKAGGDNKDGDDDKGDTGVKDDGDKKDGDDDKGKTGGKDGDDDKGKTGDKAGDDNKDDGDDNKAVDDNKDGDDNNDDGDFKGIHVGDNNNNNNNDENKKSVNGADFSSFNNDSDQPTSNDDIYFVSNSKSNENNLLVSTGDATPIVYIVISLVLSLVVLVSLKVKKTNN